MTQEVFPEIQAATEALKSRIALTETEVAEMKDSIKAKRELRRNWRKALAAFGPRRQAPKKRAAANSWPHPASGCVPQLNASIARAKMARCVVASRGRRSFYVFQCGDRAGDQFQSRTFMDST
jgi:hypothetical protein